MGNYNTDGNHIKKLLKIIDDYQWI
jgi:hypothetical protein